MPVVKRTPSFIAHQLLCPEGKSRIEMCCAETPVNLRHIKASESRRNAASRSGCLSGFGRVGFTPFFSFLQTWQVATGGLSRGPWNKCRLFGVYAAKAP